MSIRFVARAFVAPKLGNRPDELEDAYKLTGEVVQHTLWDTAYTASANRTARYAVADGATMSAFAGTWAHRLVDAFVTGQWHPTQQALQRRMKTLHRDWEEWSAELNLPWYATEKLRRGAFSTFLGLKLCKARPPSQTGGWEAIAVGDTCLFQVREHTLCASFPLTDSRQFGQHPVLLSSRPAANRAAIDTGVTVCGEWRVGDQFFLMTDALAQWFLEAYAHAHLLSMPWTVLLAESTTSSSWQHWIDEQRAVSAIRNDDATLVIVEVEGSGYPHSAPG